MRNNSEKKQVSVNFWLDLRTNVEDILHFGAPDRHLAILETIYDAYINSEWANDLEARREASVEYGIFRDLLRTLQKHAMQLPSDLPLAT